MQPSFYAFPLAIVCVLSTTFNCSEEHPCQNQNLACDDGEDCYIYCTGSHSCRFTTFICPMSTSVGVNVLCNVVCGDGTAQSEDTCYVTNVNANYSDSFSLTVNGGYNFLYGPQYSMNVTCPCEGKCDIDCGGVTLGCNQMTVNVQKSELNMVSTGDKAFWFVTVRGEYALKLTMIGNGSQTFVAANIYCPRTEKGAIKCNLKYSGNDEGFMQTKIMAIDSFSDISMICDSFSEVIECYYPPRPTIMYCLSDYSESCEMTTDDGINWSCIDTTSVCAVTQSDATSITLINIILIALIAVFALSLFALLLYCWRKRKQNKNNLAIQNKPNYYHSFEGKGVKGKHDIFVEKNAENEND